MIKMNNDIIIKDEKSTFFEEEYTFVVLPNGLRIYLYNKEGYNSTYVTYSTKYGSIDNEFIPLGYKTFVKMPEGIAHFLEHKIFECSDGIDATEKLMALGADVNAYTSYEETSFFFTTTSNVEKAVVALMGYIGERAYSVESVLKEQDIIEQERAMYADDPASVLKRNALKLLYRNHPIRIDIAGTQNSIKSITKEDLDLCHKTFYQPQNMRLTVVGKFSKDEILKAIIETSLKTNANKTAIKRREYYENEPLLEKRIVQHMDVKTPLVLIAVRIPSDKISYIEQEKRSLYLTYWLKTTFDANSQFYLKLKKSGLVTTPLQYTATISKTYQYLMISGITTNEKKFSDLIKKELLQIKQKEVDIAKFMRYQRKLTATIIRSFNSLEGITANIQEADEAEMSVFEYIKASSSLKIEELKDVQKFFDEEYLVESVVLPRK